MIFGHNCESCHDIRTYHRLTRLGFTLWKKECFSCGWIMYDLSEESVTKRYNRMLESNVRRNDRKQIRRIEREMISVKYAWKCNEHERRLKQ